MIDTMNDYLAEIQKHFSDKNSSEYTYRTAFENFLKEVFVDDKIQEVKHESSTGDSNKPDFIILENKIPNLYIECKDIPINLDKIEKSEQASRYFGYDNLIITNYIEFRFYRHGKPYGLPIHLGTIDRKNRVISEVFSDNTALLKKTIADFFRSHKEPITSGKHLAEIMGGKAYRIRENIIEILTIEGHKSAEDLEKIMKYLRENLVADLDENGFADMYAQTLVYGLFAARYNDKTLENFSRKEARELVPKTNPLLRDFFTHIALDRFPKSLGIIVDELCEVFCHADIPKLLADFYQKAKDDKDPIIHFYEDFLHEYDRKKKMEMGVFYTPEPVVDFIIRGVDEILKTEFGISKGLANSDKTEVEIAKKINDKQIKKSREFLHKVQILDIATGTGTFLDKVIQHVAKSFVGQKGAWESYVDENLIPRIHGFELMMASYTIAHLKLGITLQKLGIKNPQNRLGVYLTNTLEKIQKTVLQMSFAGIGVTETIAKESEIAGKIKNDLPIMCVIGNPPYSGISQNKNYTENNVYKVEPGGKEKLKERKHWLDDDYVKFIRYAESLIEKNTNGGIVGMITAHGYIDNPTFRGMRWHLRRTFDKIYILDLHGNSRKKEICPDGTPDQNVFDIMTGVSIIFGIKKEKAETSKNLAEIFVADLWGKRKEKFAKLDMSSIENIKWRKLPKETDIWRKEGKGKKEYEKGFSVADVFPKNTTGIVTMGDSFIIDKSKKRLNNRVDYFLNNDVSETEIKDKFSLGKNYGKWIVDNKKKIINDESKIIPLAYRPFDTRYTYFDNNLVWRPRTKVMQHFLRGENVGLCGIRINKEIDYSGVFITKNVSEARLSDRFMTNIFPLYLYHEDGTSDEFVKTPNISAEIWGEINKIAGETTPENILDYIYAVLHSPKYREKFAEFLKTNFPRVPYPKDKEIFWDLVPLGEKLRKLHLMEDSSVENFITTFSVSGDNLVEKIKYEDGKVWINSEQYFGEVPESAWNFYIGGYQPAQKWLKDRKGQNLSSDDLMHYQKIIKVLTDTEKIIQKISL